MGSEITDVVEESFTEDQLPGSYAKAVAIQAR